MLGGFEVEVAYWVLYHTSHEHDGEGAAGTECNQAAIPCKTHRCWHGGVQSGKDGTVGRAKNDSWEGGTGKESSRRSLASLPPRRSAQGRLSWVKVGGKAKERTRFWTRICILYWIKRGQKYRVRDRQF